MRSSHVHLRARHEAVTVKMTFFMKDNETMRAPKRELRLSHTRENVCACGMCAVRCTVYTARRLQTNRCCP